jgi:hypothetical protein
MTALGAGSAAASAPTAQPPAQGGAGVGITVPPAIQQTMTGQETAGGSAPAQAGAAAAAAVGWQNNKQIVALWSINQNRNSWAYVNGIGWKKLANNSDTAVVALTLLSAHARDFNRSVNYRDAADGMIHEMYVW